MIKLDRRLSEPGPRCDADSVGRDHRRNEVHALPSRAATFGRQEWLPAARRLELKNWPDLRSAIRRLADAVDAVEDGSNEYGTFYRVEGMLEGPTGNLQVVCIWMKQAIDAGSVL